MLIEHVNSNDEQVKQPLIDTTEGLDTLTRSINWAKAQRNDEDSQLLLVMGVISSCSSLLKVLTFTNFLQFGSKIKSRDSVVSEEFVERSVYLVTQVLNSNLLQSNQKNVKREDGALLNASTPTRAKANKGKAGSDVVHSKTLAELVSYCRWFPCRLMEATSIIVQALVSGGFILHPVAGVPPDPQQAIRPPLHECD